MKPLLGNMNGSLIQVFNEKGYWYVKYRGKKCLLSGCPTKVRNHALRLIEGIK